jgi:hypothetical protein
MRKIFSFLLGGALLLGAATLDLQTGSANAAGRNDRDNWRHHRHHRRHHRHRRLNKLSY